MSSRLFIENIDSEEVLRERVSSEDIAFVENFSNQARRCEALAWRAIVRREVGDAVHIDYDEYGLYAEMWSAKEAMYKFYRKGGLDLIKDISIKAFNSDRGVLCGSILGGEEIEVSVKCEDGLVVAMID